MTATVYFILEVLAFIGAVIAFSADSIEHVALMVSFIALFSVRRLEAKLEEDK